MRRLLSVLSTVVLLAAFVAWLLYLRPAPLGGPATFVIVSGTSMEPRLHDGDLVVVRRQDSYSPGDVVAFRVPEGEPGAGAMVIHRIVGGSARSGFRMQGDNKALADLWRPHDSDIVGRPWLAIPRAGRVVTTLGSPLGAGTAAGLLVFLYVLSGGAPRSPVRSAVPGPVPPFTPL
jgi:signal peptidase I